MGFAHVQ